MRKLFISSSIFSLFSLKQGRRITPDVLLLIALAFWLRPSVSVLAARENRLAVRSTERGASTYLDLQAAATTCSPSPACPAGTTLSSANWTNQFPASKSLDDLKDPFKTDAKRFVAALRDAHVTIDKVFTLRPVKRAWLMHYAYDIVTSNLKWHIDPRNVPSSADISICWVHTKANNIYDQKASVAAALDMVNAYGISPFKKPRPLLTPPALDSNHIRGRAIDMSLSWTGGVLTIKDASGKVIKITSDPKPSLIDMNPILWEVAASYGVYHFGTGKSKAPPGDDAVHWSIDGK